MPFVKGMNSIATHAHKLIYDVRSWHDDVKQTVDKGTFPFLLAS